MTKEIDNKPTFQLNPLIEAQKDFDVMETRLFYLGLQDVNPHLTENDKFFDKQFPDTIITPSELIKIFGHGQYIKEVDKAANRLISRYIHIVYEDGFDYYTIFQHIRYRENKGLFIKFSEDMRPFLLDIYQSYRKYGFTKTDMKQIFTLGSAYAMRLLELILQYRGKAKNGIIEREISIDDLRYKLNVPEGAYKGRIGNFRQFVLDKPIEDINKNTQYFITYETVKKGRSVSGFKFFCNCNKVVSDNGYTSTIESPQAPETKDSPALPAGQTEGEKTYIKLAHYGFSSKTVKALLEACSGDLSELAKRLEYGEERAKKDKEKGKEIGSISGYLRIAVEENWLGAKKNEEMAQQRELEAVKTNAEWELWAKKNFADEPAPEEPETPFDTNNDYEKMLISLITKSIKERKLDFTARRLLNDHGFTVSRFIELYM